MLRHITLGLLFYCAFELMPQTAYANEPLASIEGNLPSALKTLLLDVIGEVDEPPRSLAQARRSVKKARESAMSVMRSQGYYGAEIEARVIEVPSNIESDQRSKLRSVITIISGPQFTISASEIKYAHIESVNFVPKIPKDRLKTIILDVGAPALAAKIVASELQLVNYLNANGYPDAKALKRGAIVDHATQTMALSYNIDTGLKTRFGEIKLVGTASLSKPWPRMVAPFEPGDMFDARALNTLSARIASTGVFAGVTAELETDVTENNDDTVTRNVELNIEQGAVNTMSGELGISTTQGSGLDLAYERRNFIKYAQTLKLSSSVRTNQISLGADYNIPFAWRVDRELDFGTMIAREDTDAFSGERITGNVLLTQKFTKSFKVGLGFGLEASRYENSGEDITAYLFDGLGRATYDTRNSLFDPQSGYLLEATVTPSYNFGEEEGFFTAASLGGSHYRRLSSRFIAAGRVKIGTIFGGNLSTIPLNRRYYGGGGGSVRGFGYQSLSPLNRDGDRIGGRSIAEAGAELRYKGQGPIGFAAFVDTGSVTQKEYPDFSDIRAGAGLGLRYFTSFAPLRADIAVPLNKRAGDNPVQIYISIGQAF